MCDCGVVRIQTHHLSTIVWSHRHLRITGCQCRNAQRTTTANPLSCFFSFPQTRNRSSTNFWNRLWSCCLMPPPLLISSNHSTSQPSRPSVQKNHQSTNYWKVWALGLRFILRQKNTDTDVSCASTYSAPAWFERWSGTKWTIKKTINRKRCHGDTNASMQTPGQQFQRKIIIALTTSCLQPNLLVRSRLSLSVV